MTTLLLDALHCKNTQRPPVWLMRQAGRYLPAYRELRKKYSFLELCKTPELAVHVTELPLNIIHPDAAILFADILLIFSLFGMEPLFDDAKGPFLIQPIANSSEIEKLSALAPQEVLHYVQKAITLFKSRNTIPLLGFCGAPFTLATYLIEGKTSINCEKVKKWIYRDPKSIHLLLDKLTHATIDYLNMQIDAGVDAIQIFDSWAMVLPQSLLYEFSLSYIQKICLGLKKDIPIILFARGTSLFCREFAALNPHALAVDWSGNMATIRKAVGSKIALQGNIDPYLLHADANTIQKATRSLLDAMGKDPGFICNLGHGLLPDTPVENVQLFVETVRSYGL